MKVLHISHDFHGSKVYSNLYRSLDQAGVDQVVYTYYDDIKYEGRNSFNEVRTKIIFSKALNKYDRYFYHYKIFKLQKDIIKKIDISEIDIIHATTLFSDGGAAYKINRRYKVPYIVTVRNTDINLFLTKFYHTWPTCKRILLNASKIVFISEAHRKVFANHYYIRSFMSELSDKMVVMPNGIDDFWVDNLLKGETNQPLNHNIIYVGVYDKNKNVLALVESVINLKTNYPDIRLILVGGKGDLLSEVKELSCKYPDIVDFKGQISEKEKLKELYRTSSIFAMPSHTETFGLVYIEALSQNLACIYTKSQGIDGMFSGKIGISVDSHSRNEIEEAIDYIFLHRIEFNNEDIDFEKFRWCNIAKSYIFMYNEIKNIVRKEK